MSTIIDNFINDFMERQMSDVKALIIAKNFTGAVSVARSADAAWIKNKGFLTNQTLKQTIDKLNNDITTYANGAFDGGQLAENGVSDISQITASATSSGGVVQVRLVGKKEDEKKVKIPKPIENDFKFKNDDFIGMEQEQEEAFTQFMYPLQYKNLFKRAKSLLMYGPPGGGKSFFAKALANSFKDQLDANVFLYAPTNAEIKGKYVGDTEKNINLYFDTAQNKAEAEKDPNSLSILFFDEFEGIAGSRSKPGNKNMTSSVNQLLTNMEGASSDKFTKLIILAATNLPWDLDSAILRRFNAKIFVDIPGDNERAQLFGSTIDKQLTPNKDDYVKGRGNFLQKAFDENQYPDLHQFLINLSNITGMSKLGQLQIEDRVKKIGVREGSDYKQALEQFFEKRHHIGIDDKIALSTYGYSSSDIVKITQRALNVVAMKKLKTKADYIDQNGVSSTCYPLCPDESPQCDVCKLSSVEKDQIVLTTQDIQNCIKTINSILVNTPSSINDKEYLDYVVYYITSRDPKDADKFIKNTLPRNNKTQRSLEPSNPRRILRRSREYDSD
jgi:SpoVK/Ycf46/Vps4 family AAA+-type ATPase